MDNSVWKLFLETVYTNADDLESYMKASVNVAQDGYAQARLRQLRGETGEYPALAQRRNKDARFRNFS